MSRRRTVALSAGALAAILAAQGVTAFSQTASTPPSLDVPYVPTPQEVVDKMLELARVREDDYLIDLGSGDGRIPITAAQRFGIEAYGVDIDPKRVSEAKANARATGVADKVTFEQKNLFDTDISKATVLTLYLLPRVNLELRPRILSELKPGTRVVSHAFDMGDWKAERTEKVNGRVVFLWTVPARVEGRWVLNRDGGPQIGLEIAQDKSTVTGRATVDGRQVPLSNAAVEGERVRFEVPIPNGERMRFEGRVVENRIEGDGWAAVRAS